MRIKKTTNPCAKNYVRRQLPSADDSQHKPHPDAEEIRVEQDRRRGSAREVPFSAMVDSWRAMQGRAEKAAGKAPQSVETWTMKPSKHTGDHIPTPAAPTPMRTYLNLFVVFARPVCLRESML